MKVKAVNYKEWVKIHKPVWAAFCDKPACEDYASRVNRNGGAGNWRPEKGAHFQGWYWSPPSTVNPGYDWAVILDEEETNEFGEVCP